MALGEHAQRLQAGDDRDVVLDGATAEGDADAESGVGHGAKAY
jgi:hypothetical protein